MRKTPLSAPGGSYGRKNNQNWNNRDRNRYSFDGDNLPAGYVDRNNDNNANNKHGSSFLNVQNQSSSSSSSSPQKTVTGDDFIPLGYSSPVNHRPRFNNSMNNWRGHHHHHHRHNRGSPSSPGSCGGFNNSYRQNFYHNTPNNDFNNSSQKYYQKQQHFGQRRPYQKGSHRNVDISNYLNVKSILEDPWADLVKNFEKRNSEIGNKVQTTDLTTAAESSCENILPADYKAEQQSLNLDSVSSELQISNDKQSESTTTSTITVTETS